MKKGKNMKKMYLKLSLPLLLLAIGIIDTLVLCLHHYPYLNFFPRTEILLLIIRIIGFPMWVIVSYKIRNKNLLILTSIITLILIAFFGYLAICDIYAVGWLW